MSKDVPSDQHPTPLVTRLERKIVDASVSIGEVHADNPEYLHSVLCQIGLPRASQGSTRVFERHNGNASLLLEAGSLYDGRSFVAKPLPYGTKPRLVLIHACTEAIRTQSPYVEVGNSVTEFLKKLDMSTSGRGFQLFKNQMEALAACHMTIGVGTQQSVSTVRANPLHKFEAWLTNDGDQQVMWPGVMQLSEEFYRTLVTHAIPLDPRALRALKSSALSLDIYAFLANRLCRVRKRNGVKLSWANLKDQFGHEYKSSKDFKKSFKQSLRRVLAVYPSAKVREVPGGLMLRTSPPPIKRTTVVNLLETTSSENS